MMMEEGSISIVARPRVRREEIETLDDVQRMLWVLEPSGGARRRVIVGGRAQTLGRGTYRIEAHGDHTHLDYELLGDCSLCVAIGLPARGSFLVSVMNPDPTRWPAGPQEELFESSVVELKTPFPPALQTRFGDR